MLVAPHPVWHARLRLIRTRLELDGLAFLVEVVDPLTGTTEAGVVDVADVVGVVVDQPVGALVVLVGVEADRAVGEEGGDQADADQDVRDIHGTLRVVGDVARNRVSRLRGGFARLAGCETKRKMSIC